MFTFIKKEEKAQLSMIGAAIVFVFSSWFLLYTTMMLLGEALRSLLHMADRRVRNSFIRFVARLRTETGGGTNKPKSDAKTETTMTRNTSTTATSSNTNSNPLKRDSRPWIPPSPPSKKSTPTIATDVRPPTAVIRDVFIIFRSFRFQNNLMGFAIWNSFTWRTDIDAYYGLPANAYIRLFDVCTPSALPPIVEESEATTYLATNDSTETNKHSLAHLLLFSVAERHEWHLTSQLQGFHFVTKRGLNAVPITKWLNQDDGNHEGLTEEQMTNELEDSFVGCQEFLREVAQATHNPATPGTHMNSPARYTLVRQRRNIPLDALPLFDRLLNCARGNVSRPNTNWGTVAVEAQTGDI